MDDIPGFLAAILDDPESTAPRLAFADWLEARGEAGRAEWIRASCAFAGVTSRDPGWQGLWERREAAFQACRPDWWADLTGVDQENDAGIFRFRVGGSGGTRSARPIRRLAKAAWIARAVAEGWLARVEVLWSDTELAAELAKWSGPVLEAPLLVRA
ncbi:MAG: TIGR02996 domain-containing protein, partial [Isosphaeraceae bacterium]